MEIFDYLILTLSIALILASLLKYKKAKSLIYLSDILLIFWLIIRTVITKHAPFSNVFETVVMFAVIYLLKISFSKKQIRENTFLKLPALLLCLTALFFPSGLRQPGALPEILNSYWFYIHVPSYFIGYVSLLFAFVLSIINIVSNKIDDGIIENELKLSVFFMTLGLFTGSAWANLSWSHFWGWDPKEIWALITWLITILAIHFKQGKFRTIFITLAFASMIFTYFGVSFLLNGLHSYK